MDVKQGAYDKECEKLLADTKADMTLLLVVNGNKKHGMSCCINAQHPHAEDMAKKVPELLRKMAEYIERSGEFQHGPRLHKPDSDKSWSEIAEEKKKEDED